MANKNALDTLPLAIDDATKAGLAFNKAVYELGLKLIEDYRAGKCSDRAKTLEAIIKIFRVSNNVERPFLSGGIIDEFGI